MSLLNVATGAGPFPREIYQAAKEGNKSKIENFLKNSHRWINAPNQKGNSLLFYAAKKGHFDLVKYLISQEACAYSNNAEQSCLSVAAKNVKKMIKHAHTDQFTSLFEKTFLQTPPQEAIKHISSLDWILVRNEILRDYAIHQGFEGNDDIIDYCHDDNQKAIIAENLIKTFCACADVESAKHALKKTPDSMQPKLERLISQFETILDEREAWAKENPQEFANLIHFSADLSRIHFQADDEKTIGPQNFSKIEIDEIRDELVYSGSLKEALAIANAYDNRKKPFARAILGSTPLHLDVLDLAEENEEEFGGEYLEELLNQPSINFDKINEVIASADKFQREQLKLNVAIIACEKQAFHEACDLIKNIDFSQMNPDEVQEYREALLETIDDVEWKKKIEHFFLNFQ